MKTDAIHYYSSGSFSAFKYFIGVLSRVRRAETGSEQDPQPTHPVQSLITFFLCGWFITGCVWVYRSVRYVEN